MNFCDSLFILNLNFFTLLCINHHQFSRNVSLNMEIRCTIYFVNLDLFIFYFEFEYSYILEKYHLHLRYLVYEIFCKF